MRVRRAAVKRQAEHAAQGVLQPGERILAGAAVACGPSWGQIACVAAVALALLTEGLAGIFGPYPNLLSGSLPAAVGTGLPLLAVGMASRPMYIAVSEQRLIGLRLSRLDGTPGRLAFEAPLSDICITDHRRRRSGRSVRCEIRGRKRTRLNVERAWYPDFAEVTTNLCHMGAMTEWDRPYPSAANS